MNSKIKKVPMKVRTIIENDGRNLKGEVSSRLFLKIYNSISLRRLIKGVNNIKKIKMENIIIVLSVEIEEKINSRRYIPKIIQNLNKIINCSLIILYILKIFI